jgi:hypothetical protein
MLRCPKPAVAKLARPLWSPDKPRRWWHYCADHLYGRRIYEGVVYSSRLIAVDDPLPDDCFESAQFELVA